MPASRFGGLLLGFALVLPGCAGPVDADLVIASCWPQVERDKLEVEFGRWVETSRGIAVGTLRVGWIELGPGDDLARIVRRREPPDLALGGPVSSYLALERQDLLEPSKHDVTSRWFVVRRTPLGLAMNVRAARASERSTLKSGTGASPTAPRRRELTFDDPRHDPIALAWAKAHLRAGTWSEGYARLVQNASHPRRIGRQAGSALAAVERGEIALTPAPAPRGPARTSVRFVPIPEAPEWVEGVSLVRGGRHPDLAHDFLSFLNERGQAKSPAGDPRSDPVADDLLADLLGATLVDAQDELWRAWDALDRSGRPDRAETWMTQPPPWPPASVARLIKRGPSADLLDLAAQVAPEAEARAWLLRSWLGPNERLIDSRLLGELSAAAGGRLAREPRFRAWLRGEWTAWARQRYRRVARVAGVETS